MTSVTPSRDPDHGTPSQCPRIVEVEGACHEEPGRHAGRHGRTRHGNGGRRAHHRLWPSVGGPAVGASLHRASRRRDCGPAHRDCGRRARPHHRGGSFCRLRPAPQPALVRTPDADLHECDLGLGWRWPGSPRRTDSGAMLGSKARRGSPRLFPCSRKEAMMGTPRVLAWLVVLIGLVLAITPWLLRFAGDRVAQLDVVIGGAIVALLGIALIFAV